MFEITVEMTERLAKHEYARSAPQSFRPGDLIPTWDELTAKCRSAWREDARDALEVARGGAGAV